MDRQEAVGVRYCQSFAKASLFSWHSHKPGREMLELWLLACKMSCINAFKVVINSSLQTGGQLVFWDREVGVILGHRPNSE